MLVLLLSIQTAQRHTWCKINLNVKTSFYKFSFPKGLKVLHFAVIKCIFNKNI